MSELCDQSDLYTICKSESQSETQMDNQLELQEISKQQQTKETSQSEDESPQMGTEILDPTLPSDLDFDQKLSNEETEQIKFDNALKATQPHRKSSLEGVELLQCYSVRGSKGIFNLQPQYERGQFIVKVTEQPFTAKLYDQQESTSSSLMKIWEAVVGYVKRDLLFLEGYFYITEAKPEGLMVVQVEKLMNLFKVFVDEEENKIRLAFSEGEAIIKKDFKVKNVKAFMERLLDELSKFGLRLEGVE